MSAIIEPPLMPSEVLNAAEVASQMHAGISKARAFEAAKQKQAAEDSALDPRKIFKVGDEITIVGLADPLQNGLYKVEEITDIGVKYRKLRWHEKLYRRFRESIGAA